MLIITSNLMISTDKIKLQLHNKTQLQFRIATHVQKVKKFVYVYYKPSIYFRGLLIAGKIRPRINNKPPSNQVPFLSLLS